jgi:hypothetical protein
MARGIGSCNGCKATIPVIPNRPPPAPTRPPENFLPLETGKKRNFFLRVEVNYVKRKIMGVD